MELDKISTWCSVFRVTPHSRLCLQHLLRVDIVWYPDPHLAHKRRRGLVSASPVSVDYKLRSVNNEFYNILLSGTIEVLVLTLASCTLLELAQGFRLVTPDPFSLCELGRV